MATLSTATVQALGNLRDLSKKEETFFVNGMKDRKLFPVLPDPDKHDWLSSHSETKQSHDSWWQRLQTVIPPSRKDKKKICLVPLSDEWTQSEVEIDKNGKKQRFLSLLQHFATVFFMGFQVDVLPPVSIAKLKCKTRMNGGTLQLHIPDVYKYLQAKWPPGAFCVVGITMIDLYPKESWNFVFGQANSSIGVGVFSFARYNPLFYEDDPEKRVSLCTSNLVLWRSCKVMVHEICHLFCLRHCIFFSCCMNGSNHLEESNNRPMFMCPVCLHKLKSWLSFDVKQRYQAMLEFCSSIKDENFEGSCRWLEKAIEKLS